MRTNRLHLWLGIGLSSAIAVAACGQSDGSQTPGTTDGQGRTAAEWEADPLQPPPAAPAAVGALSREQASDLIDQVLNALDRVDQAVAAIGRREHDDARDHIVAASAELQGLSSRAAELGLSTSESLGTAYGRGADDEIALSQEWVNEAVIRTTIYDGSQLVSLTRLLAEARRADDQRDITVYGRGSMADSPADSDAADNSGPSVVVVDLVDFDLYLATARRSAENNEFEDVRQALEEIQTQTVSIEYSAMHQPLRRIGQDLAVAGDAIESGNLPEARTALQSLDAELERFSQTSSLDVQSEVQSVRDDIKSLSTESAATADETGVKVADMWGQMSDWFDDPVATID